MIYGNKIGGARDAKTYVIADEKETFKVLGVVVEQEEIFDATCEDVKEGKKFACDGGVMTGANDAPSYRVTCGTREIAPSADFSIDMEPYDQWNYTSLSCMIAPKSNPNKVEKVVLYDVVYDNTGAELAPVTKDKSNKTINLNITNTTKETYLIHFIVCKEEFV